MKKILYISILIVSFLFSACEKDAYEPSNIKATKTYRLYNPIYNLNVIDGIYEMFVYRDIPQLTVFKGQQYSQCFVEKIQNFKDDSNAEMYSFSFDRIVETNEDGTPKTIQKYVIKSYKDLSTYTDPDTGELYHKESSLTVLDTDGNVIKKYDYIGVIERTRYID